MRGRWCLLSAILVASAACSNERGEARIPGAIQVPFAYASPGSLPTDFYLRPSRDLAASSGIESVLKQRYSRFGECMSDAGFEIVEAPSIVSEDVPANPVDANAPFPAQEDWVKRNGYSILTGRAVVAVEDNQLPYRGDKLSLYFTYRGRCIRGAREAFPLPVTAGSPADGVQEVAQSIATDFRWTDAFSLWAQCMRTEGFEYQSHADAVAALAEMAERGELDFEEERRVALADLNCTKEVFGEQRAVEYEYNLASGLLDP